MCPFAGFKDFDECCSIQMRKHKGEKGFTIESARKICGFIKHKVEKEMVEVTAMETKRKELGMSPSEFYAIPREPPSDSKLPIFDEAHCRAAMSRWNQVTGVSSEEKSLAKKKIINKAKKFGIEIKNF